MQIDKKAKEKGKQQKSEQQKDEKQKLPPKKKKKKNQKTYLYKRLRSSFKSAGHRRATS